MPADRRDAEFVAAVDRNRSLLRGTARLLLDDPQAADSVLDSVLARLHRRGLAPVALRLEALRGLVSDEQPGPLPWSSAPSFELVDGPGPGARDDLLADLARLTREQRAAIVLERFTLLPSLQIAEVLDRPVDEVLVLARQARAALAAGHPERTDDHALGEELRTAAGGAPSPVTGRDDLAHGRRLVRRRLVRRTMVLAAAVAVLVLVITQLRPVATPTVEAPVPTVMASSGPPSPAPECDSSEKTCQATILRDWRDDMGLVISYQLDPEKRYFTGHSFSYNSRYETPGFWTGEGGALGLEMNRFPQGSTEVYLQIATSRAEAVRCGVVTENTCVSMRFMDGNRFIMTDTTRVADGLEVQYSPYGDQVITVIARNTTRGKKLALDRGQLIALVQDPRLRLPSI